MLIGHTDARAGPRDSASNDPFYGKKEPENPQVNGHKSALEELPRHDHALDLVGALVDLGDRGLAGSLRR